jgi:LemA protein
MDSDLILARLYRLPLRKRRPKVPLFRRLRDRLVRTLGVVSERYSTKLAIGALIVGAWLAAHTYYYNNLTLLEFDCRAAWAQIEVVQVKRNHIQRNLVRLLRYYADYEGTLMKDVTDIRAQADAAAADATNAGIAAVDAAGDEAARGAAPAEPSGDVGGLLGRLRMVAENYPSLHLTNTVQQFSAAIIDTESAIALRIADDHSAVNRYTTVTHQFPGIMFARPLGFEDFEFYTADDPRILKYREVEL